jgi:hypothetical protein
MRLLLSLLLTLQLALAPSGGDAGAGAGLGQCVRSAHCAMRLARDIADGFGAEYAGQLTLVSAAGMGGRYVLQHGDEVVGFIDDLGDGIRVVSQIPGAERIVFDSASNTHGYFDNAGQWVDTWTVPTQIDVSFPTNIQHLLPPPANRIHGLPPSELSNQRLLDGVGGLDVSTGRNQSVFYSGRGAREAAEAHATENGLTTLEQTTGGRYLDDLRLFDGTVADVGGDQAAAIWGRISSNYASQASGNVTAIVNNPRSSSIFLIQELPTLLQNPNVTQVTIRSVSGSQVTIPRGASINDALGMIEGF